MSALVSLKCPMHYLDANMGDCVHMTLGLYISKIRFFSNSNHKTPADVRIGQENLMLQRRVFAKASTRL
jgi:hypothetical protein